LPRPKRDARQFLITSLLPRNAELKTQHAEIGFQKFIDQFAKVEVGLFLELVYWQRKNYLIKL